MTEHIEVDYLIVGAGAMGMAFADTLLAETDKTMVIVDRHAKPGGHWNDAYPFVTLHQPSAYYGVSSRELSTGRIDQTGLNKGLNDLATLPQLMAYFEAVMGEQFLPSGRVRYLPLCNHLGGGVVEAVLGKARYQITVREKIVDATWLKTTVPSTHEPNFDVASGVNFMPLNELPKLAEAPSDYVVIGGGKTGIDAVIWLLEHGVDPAVIRWVMPRDAWLFTRETTQPGAAYFEATIGAQANLMQAVAEAETVPGLFLRLEQAGIFTRIDPSITPKMMHGATISQPELEALRSVKHVLRKGRVVRIGPNHFELEQGREPCGPDTLFIDCSARAVGNMQVRPVFEDDTIYLQTVRTVQPVFSAAFIAHIEATRDTEDEKNRLCQIVPLPNHDTDWLYMQRAFMMNQYVWGQEPDLRSWLLNNRLDGYSQMVAEVEQDETEKRAILKRLRANMMPAMANLNRLIADREAVVA